MVIRMEYILFDDAKKPNAISNFRPEVQALVNVYASGDAAPETKVELRLHFGDDKDSELFTVPLSQLEKFDWLAQDIRCRLNPKVAKSKAYRYIANEVRKVLHNMTPLKQYRLDRLGCHIIEGVPVFNTGGGLICPPSFEEKKLDVKLAPMSFSIDIDETLSEEEAVVGMLELVSLSPNAGMIILAHSLLYIMRSVYAEVWKSPCCCVFLYGKTGTKKTTLSAFLTQMYNRGRGIASPPRLNASISSAVAIIYEKNDCVVVLDDLYPAGSKETRQTQEKTLLEITRIIADGIEPARMRGHKVAKAPTTCGTLFTGEYLIGTGSDAARLLPVEMTAPDGKRLKEFQDQPLLVSTFYNGFITWFISNYYGIRDWLKEYCNLYNEANSGVNIHDRLKETYFFLSTAYAMLLQYCFEKGLLQEENTSILHLSFSTLLSDLIRAQEKRVVQGTVSEAERIDFLARISLKYKNGEIILAENPGQFKEREYDGVIHNRELCLRSDTLRRIFPGIGPEDVAKGLLTQGALRPGTKDLQIQIYAAGGKRFYAIPLNKLR